MSNKTVSDLDYLRGQPTNEVTKRLKNKTKADLAKLLLHALHELNHTTAEVSRLNRLLEERAVTLTYKDRAVAELVAEMAVKDNMLKRWKAVSDNLFQLYTLEQGSKAESTVDTAEPSPVKHLTAEEVLLSSMSRADIYRKMMSLGALKTEKEEQKFLRSSYEEQRDACLSFLRSVASI